MYSEGGTLYNKYRKDIEQYPLLTPEREKELSDIVQRSQDEKKIEKALEEMVLSNLRLVMKCAYSFYQKIGKHYPSNIVSLMDLIEEGNIGLMRAAKNFDADKGAKFSTYAFISIQQAMERKFNSSNFIYIPPRHNYLLSQIRKLRQEHGGEVSDEVIMEKLEIGKVLLERLKDSENSFVRSFEELVEEDIEGNRSNFLDFYVSDEEGLEDMLHRKEMKEYIFGLLKKLPTREQEIIIQHFYSDRPISNQDIVDKLQVTKQRVSMLYHEALAKLRKFILTDIRNGKISLPESLHKKFEEIKQSPEINRSNLRNQHSLSNEERENIIKMLRETNERKKYNEHRKDSSERTDISEEIL